MKFYPIVNEIDRKRWLNLFLFEFSEDKRRKYDQLGRAGLSNGHGNTNYSSHNGYSRFSEDFLNRQFHFHNPFDIFEQFMSHFGMDDDFGKFHFHFSERIFNFERNKNL